MRIQEMRNAYTVSRRIEIAVTYEWLWFYFYEDIKMPLSASFHFQ